MASLPGTEKTILRYKNKGSFMQKEHLPYARIRFYLFALEEQFMTLRVVSNEKKRQGYVSLTPLEFTSKFSRSAR
jgi:hypothetical protein